MNGAGGNRTPRTLCVLPTRQGDSAIDRNRVTQNVTHRVPWGRGGGRAGAPPPFGKSWGTTRRTDRRGGPYGAGRHMVAPRGGGACAPPPGGSGRCDAPSQPGHSGARSHARPGSRGTWRVRPWANPEARDRALMRPADAQGHCEPSPSVPSLLCARGSPATVGRRGGALFGNTRAAKRAGVRTRRDADTGRAIHQRREGPPSRGSGRHRTSRR